MMPLLVLLALMAANAPEAAPPQVRARADGLQGEWVLIETADERRTDRGSEQVRMVIDGASVILSFRGLETSRGTIALAAPDRIDLKLRGGLDFAGVYQVEGDVLTICFAQAGQPRPALRTPTGAQWREKWQRVAR